MEGYVPPFTAVKNEEQVTTGGIVGTSYNTFLEKCFYGDGCVGDGYNDIGTALPSDELLSDAQVRTMNSAASGIVLSEDVEAGRKRTCIDRGGLCAVQLVDFGRKLRCLVV